MLQKLHPSLIKMQMKKKVSKKYSTFGHSAATKATTTLDCFLMASTNLWFLKAAVGTLLISPQVTDMQFTAVSAEVSEQSWLHSYFNEFWRHNILKDLSLKLNQNRCMQEHFSKKTSRTTHDISVENELFIRNIANLHDEMPHILRGVRTEQSQR